MKICLSIAPSSMREALAQMQAVPRGADLVEVRIDRLADLDLDRLLQQPRPKMIITNRRLLDGGYFAGDSREQLSILGQAVELGVEFVDLELNWGQDVIHHLQSHLSSTQLIVSYHNFSETPKTLVSIYRQIQRTGADIVKIATTAKDITDTVRVLDLCKLARSENQPIIAHAMGERGEISRILCGKHDAFLTFASLTDELCTSPGQRRVDELKNLFRVHLLNSRTKVFGLIGNPVSHSHGVVFHNKVFSRRSLNAVYLNFLVDNLREFFHSMKDIISGYSITMPFKAEATQLVDRLEDGARKLGLVNTIVKRRSAFVGLNCDLPAIVSILAKLPSIRKKCVVVLGTGATSKTMAYAALSLGAQTTIVGRDSKKARSIAAELGCEAASFELLLDTPCDLLMNGTSVGMLNQQVAQETPLVPGSLLRKGMIVLDAVYKPPTTPLLLRAQSAGCTIIPGTELFRRQAQLQSESFLSILR